MDVASEHKMNLKAGDTFCVDIVEFPATHLSSIVSLDYYFNKIFLFVLSFIGLFKMIFFPVSKNVI